ncbi:MAG: glycosyltransferase family 2 protein, partial [Vulcanisaeta sp.]
MKPYISVIITEYRPRGFLKYAVRSVLNQSLSKDLFEIVLVKLRKDEFVDRLIEESGGKVLYLAEAPIGYYLYRGIQESNGDVLVFLDDDAFAARKLNYIYDLFSQKSNLGYY